jgi:hypothetical protein
MKPKWWQLFDWLCYSSDEDVVTFVSKTVTFDGWPEIPVKVITPYPKYEAGDIINNGLKVIQYRGLDKDHIDPMTRYLVERSDGTRSWQWRVPVKDGSLLYDKDVVRIVEGLQEVIHVYLVEDESGNRFEVRESQLNHSKNHCARCAKARQHSYPNFLANGVERKF